jgi:glycosyltransferase involved in cell wall biosynthesis
MIKIAYVHSNSNVLAGQEKVLIDLVCGFDKKQVDPLIVLPCEGIFAQVLRRRGIKVKFIKLSRFRMRRPWLFIQTVIGLYLLIKKEKINLIHTSGMYPNQYCIITARLAGIRCVCHIHSTIYKKDEIADSLLRFADYSIAVSEGVKDVLVSAGILEGKISVVYNGLKANEYKIENEKVDRIKKELGLLSGMFIVSQLGQIIERKGIVTFLKMAQFVLEKNKNVRFLLVGDDKFEPGYMKQMKELTKKYSLEGFVIFTGYQQDVVTFLGLSDIIVLCSFVEGLPVIVTEAMLLGKPVIATDIPGTREVVKHMITGLLVSVQDSQATAAHVLALLDDTDLQKKLTSEAKKMIVEKFSLDKQLDEVLCIYKKIISCS